MAYYTLFFSAPCEIAFLPIPQTSEKRKGLLDEMAIAMQVKSDEGSKAIAALQEELDASRSEALDNLEKFEAASKEADEAKRSESEARKSYAAAKERMEEMKATLEKTRADHEEELRRAAEARKDEVGIVKQEADLVVRDLRTQLEISNAQRSEFEESITHIDQEMRDKQEEARIAEKKTAALVKDLKRQLRQEKQTNEKLQEKMKEVSIGGGAGSAASDAGNRQHEFEADRSSISSWSLMSGQNEGNGNSRSTPIPGLGGGGGSITSNASSPANGALEALPLDSPPPPLPLSQLSKQPSFTQEDYGMLLDKVNQLQDCRLTLEEKVQMLEHSAAAMADDLLRKSAIIQCYCMETRTSGKELTLSRQLDPYWIVLSCSSYTFGARQQRPLYPDDGQGEEDCRPVRASRRGDAEGGAADAEPARGDPHEKHAPHGGPGEPLAGGRQALQAGGHGGRAAKAMSDTHAHICCILILRFAYRKCS